MRKGRWKGRRHKSNQQGGKEENVRSKKGTREGEGSENGMEGEGMT